MAVSQSVSEANRQQLYNAGLTDDTIAQGAQALAMNLGPKVNPVEMSRLLEWYKGTQPTGATTPTTGTQTQSFTPTSLTYMPSATVAQGAPEAPPTTTYEFKLEDYLPKIQQEASLIYQPQREQLEAIKQLQQSQYEETKLQTEEQFKKRMQGEIEGINRRGAYFGGGAIANEQAIRTEQERSLKQLNLQYLASQAELASQQGAISAQEAQYIKDQLYREKGSAYEQWQDKRNFEYQRYRDQVGDYQAERTFDYDKYRDTIADYKWQNEFDRQKYVEDRDFSFKVLTDKRDFGWEVEKFQKQYNLSKKELELAYKKFDEDKYQFGETYALNKSQLELDWFKEENKDDKDAADKKFTNLARELQSRMVDGVIQPADWNEAKKAFISEFGGQFKDAGYQFDRMYWSYLPTRVNWDSMGNPTVEDTNKYNWVLEQYNFTPPTSSGW
jgi:hypothetical protein